MHYKKLRQSKPDQPFPFFENPGISFEAPWRLEGGQLSVQEVRPSDKHFWKPDAQVLRCDTVDVWSPSD